MIDINIISYRSTDPYFLQMFFAFCLKNRPLGTWFEILLGCGGCCNHLTYEVTSFMQKNDTPIWRLVGNPYHLPWKKYLYKLWSIISILIYPSSWWMLQGIPGVSLAFLGEELCVSIITSFGNHRDVLEGCTLRHEWLVLHPCTIPSNFPNYIKLFFVQDQIQFKRHVDASWFATLFSWC